MAQHILEPGAIRDGSVPDVPLIRLPDTAYLFAERAERLRQLAPAHAMGDYLQFVAAVADAQHSVLQSMPSPALPESAFLASARAHGMPPFNAREHVRNPVWRIAMRGLLKEIEPAIAGVARDIVKRLAMESDPVCEAQADRVLNGVTAGLDFAFAPLIAAALQVYWVKLVAVQGLSGLVSLDVATVCPSCGTRPVASIVRSGGASGGHRYLHCALCATEWHMVRIKCSDCESTTGINYFGIDGGAAAVKAESCDACSGYLKIFYSEKDAQVEPGADDLASTALDLLMADAGKFRSGPNLMLFAADAE